MSRELNTIIGQTTEDISKLIENLRVNQSPFVFAKAGNPRKYNKSKGKHKSK